MTVTGGAGAGATSVNIYGMPGMPGDVRNAARGARPREWVPGMMEAVNEPRVVNPMPRMFDAGDPRTPSPMPIMFDVDDPRTPSPMPGMFDAADPRAPSPMPAMFAAGAARPSFPSMAGIEFAQCGPAMALAFAGSFALGYGVAHWMKKRR